MSYLRTRLLVEPARKALVPDSYTMR